MPTITELFGIRTMLSPAVSLHEDLDPWPFVEMFQSSPNRKTVMGDIVSWDREDFTRELAPFGDQEAAAIRLHKNDRQLLTLPMAQIRIERFIPAHRVWVSERGLGDEAAPGAANEIRRAGRHLENAVRRSAEFISSQVMVNPAGVTVNPTVVPGSQVTFTLDFAIPDSNAAAPWSTVTTEIVSNTELLAFKDTTINVSGMNPSLAIFNNTVADYLFRNDQIEAWLLRTEPGIRFLNQIGPGGDRGAQQTSGVMAFGGIAGIKDWWQFDHGFQNVGGAFTKYIATDHMLIGPGGGPTLGWAEGFQAIPNVAIGAEAMPMISTRPGAVTYSVLEPDPVGIKIIRAYSFIPTVFIPEAWRLIDTTP